ncbi:amino acid adenylation domain-containing protein [Halopseudomonas sabulinigri]|uniref:Amino acid adenylation domain-containing protein n=1 Tax=Halopseudomonas sabulinigri TaxID=472181 RepID=A0A1H1UGB3_9GAMM|nr:amino acid adenylation domain-containing protein [Halopseudomonas sabulinigri]SDS71574.1 amino acid adenylation domain-containing protein [Halopseudomonas sabulinigri]
MNTHFEQVFALNAERAALGMAGVGWSYQRLARRVAAIAEQLCRLGLQPGDRVGLHLGRSPDLLAALLACLRGGLCFVPLEPDFPARRLQAIASEAQLAVVLHDQPALSFCSPAQPLTREDCAPLPWPKQDPALPAYMMFTSGSTGTPKGVVISRRALALFLHSATDRLRLAADCRWLFVTTPAFDISLLEMLGPLWVGGCVEVADSRTYKDPLALAARLTEQPAISHLQATPAFWRMLLKAGWPGQSQLTALCGGEALDTTLAQQLRSCCARLWNCYGPTEATIWSLLRQVELPLAQRRVSIGGSLAGYRHWVMDEQGKPVAAGESGELCIESDALFAGYWQRDDLTAQVTLMQGQRRLYRTGDRVRQLAEDEFEYLGRRDDQVKLRGFRIELGEVEAGLRRLAGVQDAAVRLQGSGETACLVGYVELATAGSLSRLVIRKALQQVLPHYMVPARILLLEALPKTASGKLDRKALPLAAGAEVAGVD